jgi:hypothetical protein
MIGDGTSAKHSQFLAQIKTDVPFDIDAMNFKRETSDVIYTPALIEFLKKYEFRSLLPGDIVYTAPVYTLDTPAKSTRENHTGTHGENTKKHSLLSRPQRSSDDDRTRDSFE